MPQIFDNIEAKICLASFSFQREFDGLKNELNTLLKERYDLGRDDSLIPLIKEMYEAN